MAQKNATPTKAQTDTLARNGLNKLVWVVVQELNFTMIVRNRLTGEFRVIDKEGGQYGEGNHDR